MSVVVKVLLSLISVMSPPHALCNLSTRTVLKLCILGVCFRGELGFLNCDDICMCVVNNNNNNNNICLKSNIQTSSVDFNKQFEFLEFVFDSVHVDLQYDEISLTLLLGLCPCVVSVVMWSSLVWL